MGTNAPLPKIAVGSDRKLSYRETGIDIINMTFDDALKTLRKGCIRLKNAEKH